MRTDKLSTCRSNKPPRVWQDDCSYMYHAWDNGWEDGDDFNRAGGLSDSDWIGLRSEIHKAYMPVGWREGQQLPPHWR